MSIRQVRQSSRDLIYADLLDKIQYCVWQPGTPIGETALSEMFHVSKTPVREALLMLARDGYVDIYPQSGSYVSKIDLKRVHEIIYLRNAVEKSVMTELAAKRAVIPSNIKKILLLQEYAMEEENWVECVQQDYAFHKALFELAGHAALWEIVQSILPHYTRLRFFALEIQNDEFQRSSISPDAPTTLEEHKLLVEYIEAGDIAQVSKITDSSHDYNYRKQYKRDIMTKYSNYFTSVDFLKQTP